jgi:hypothetical protein
VSGDRRRPEDHLELDILEEYMPELATDDRVSRPASIARSHRELGNRGPLGPRGNKLRSDGPGTPAPGSSCLTLRPTLGVPGWR